MTLIPRPEDFTSTARGPATTARVGVWLGIAFTICFVTGFWSHLQYAPPSWLPIGPSPSWLYRVTQGLHVISASPQFRCLLVKLWSVFPGCSYGRRSHRSGPRCCTAWSGFGARR